MSKLSTLDKLADALLKLVTLLALDPSCQWTKKFKLDQERADQLRLLPLNFRELAELSASIRYVFGGMGSFNDYAPTRYVPATGRYLAIPGTEEFDALRKEVFDLALELIAAEPTN